MTDDPARQQLELRPELDSTAALEALVVELRGVLDAIRTAHELLAAHPDPFGPCEAELRALLERRDAIAREIGLVVARVVSSGGTVSAAPGPLPVARRTDGAEHHDDAQHADDVLAGPDAAPRLAAPPVDPVAVPSGEVVDDAAEQVGGDVLAGATLVPEEVSGAHLHPPAAPDSAPPTSDAETDAPGPVETAPASPAAEGPAPSVVERRDLRQILDDIGRPQRVTDAEAADAVINRLCAAIDRRDEWLAYPLEVQRPLVGLVSSIARHVQDEAEFRLDSHNETRLKRWFSQMTRWSGQYKPGYVPGLSRSNPPTLDSWLADAEHWWWTLADLATPRAAAVAEAAVRPWTPPPRARQSTDELEPEITSHGEALDAAETALAGSDDAALASAIKVAVDSRSNPGDQRLIELLAPHADRLAKLPGLKTLKKDVRAATTNGAEPPSKPAPSSVPPAEPKVPADWPFRRLTEGKIAVMIGGSPRPASGKNIQEAFGFAELAWDLTDTRRVAALAKRVRQGRIEFVILLKQFIGHGDGDALIDAAKASGTPFVMVDAGYGVEQVRLAIERYLRGRIAP